MARVDTSTLEGVNAASKPTDSTSDLDKRIAQAISDNAAAGKTADAAAAAALADLNNPNSPANLADKAAATAESSLLSGGTAAIPAGSSDAFDAFRAKFQAIGMGSLADTLLKLSTSPDAPTTASGYYAALLQTPEYKARFGDTNAMRQKNGLPMLTEGQILASEQNISDTLRRAGMPAGFYDQPQDFQQFIALDKSAQEVGDIVQAYKDVAKNINPAISNQLMTYYGVDSAGIAAYLMDPTKAQPILNSLAQKGTVAAAAASGGMQDIAGAAQVAYGLDAGSLSYAKQAQAFAQANQLGQQVGTLSNIYGNVYGGTYTTGQGMQEAFGGPEAVQAQQLRQRLATAETSTFGGSAGASTQGQSLGVGNAQGVS